MNKQLPAGATFLIDFNLHNVPAAQGLEVPPAAQAAIFGADAATVATYRQAVQTQVQAVAQRLLAQEEMHAAFDAWPLAPGDTVLFLGDSITTYLYSYARLLQSMIAAHHEGKDITVINGAQSGYTSTHGLEETFTQHLPRRPQWVFIKYGVNDCKQFGDPQAKTLVSAAEYEANLCAMVDAFQAQDARVILLTPTPVVPAVLAENPDLQAMQLSWDNANLQAFAAIARTLAAEHHIPSVDLMAAFTPTPDPALYLDGLHPSPDGQQLILKAVLQALGQTADH
ncbi:MAG TPA: GDSL-type esterase/lipase family protein [Candidatus Sulfomarinibacteraceae bacterium]|nr:GDSL-type esterase/lipase family protein [Candidatus Sulfomarinibacteraceae bacterium]